MMQMVADTKEDCSSKAEEFGVLGLIRAEGV